jgi:hypothetical protein
MALSTLVGLFFIPVTFSVVEYLSHRFIRGGKGTTMDSGCGPKTPARVPPPVVAHARTEEGQA